MKTHNQVNTFKLIDWIIIGSFVAEREAKLKDREWFSTVQAVTTVSAAGQRKTKAQITQQTVSKLTDLHHSYSLHIVSLLFVCMHAGWGLQGNNDVQLKPSLHLCCISALFCVLSGNAVIDNLKTRNKVRIRSTHLNLYYMLSEKKKQDTVKWTLHKSSSSILAFLEAICSSALMLWLLNVCSTEKKKYLNVSFQHLLDEETGTVYARCFVSLKDFKITDNIIWLL